MAGSGRALSHEAACSSGRGSSLPLPLPPCQPRRQGSLAQRLDQPAICGIVRQHGATLRLQRAATQACGSAGSGSAGSSSDASRSSSGGRVLPDIIVREAELADLDAMEAIELHSREGGNWSREQLLEELQRPRACVYVAELCSSSGGGDTGPPAICGLAVGWLVVDEVHVLEVAVAPEARRRGVGTALMRALMQHAPTDGIGLLEVRAGNAGAVRLYEALGWEAAGLRRRYYPDGEDALLMNWRRQ